MGAFLRLGSIVALLALGIASDACSDYRGNDTPCDELQRAREFNEMLNSGTTATQSRSYDWVRKQMNAKQLPGTRWEVGHMCPNEKGSGRQGKGAGPEDKARNLMAQTMKDNRGPGGLFHRQMSHNEAIFYSRTLTTCAELGKTEL